jgi:hypothetical protein
MRHDIVWRVERLAVVGIGDDGRRPVMLPADDAAVEMLARNLTALEIECIAVAVVGRPAKHGHPTVVPDVAVLHIARDVAEHDVAALARPGRALGPQRAGPHTIDRPLVSSQRQERLVDDDHIGVRVDRRVSRRKVARGAADDCRRCAEIGVLLAPRGAGHRCCGGQARGTLEQAASRQRLPANSLLLHRVAPFPIDLVDCDRGGWGEATSRPRCIRAMRERKTVSPISRCKPRLCRVLECSGR